MARSGRNELVAGLFILASLVALVVVLVLIGNWRELGRARVTYYVKFQQVRGVKVGSPVLLGGVAKGRVTDIKIQWSPPDQQTGAQTFSYILALEVPADIVLRRDAVVAIESPLIGEGSSINIENVGTSERADDTREKPLAGRGGDMFTNALRALGIGDQERKDLVEAIHNIKSITASINETAPKIGKTVDDVGAVTAGLRERLPKILDTVQAGAGKLDSAAGRVDGILAENRDKLRESVANVNEMTASAKKSMEDLLGNLKGASQDVRTLIAANRMNLTDTMVNVRETSEQLKAASVEIRRAPWRLFYRPDKREADTLNVFDASLNYSNAVADLRSAATTFASLVQIDRDETPVDRKMLEDMLDRIRAGLKKYDEAESALWKEWGQADQPK